MISIDREDYECRAMRVCPHCGGDQFDWGAGIRDDGSGWFVSWECAACGAHDGERVSNARLLYLRSRPPPREGYA